MTQEIGFVRRACMRREVAHRIYREYEREVVAFGLEPAAGSRAVGVGASAASKTAPRGAGTRT